ncbi:MAG: ribonuclease HII [Nanoarchaeota archaeon]
MLILGIDDAGRGPLIGPMILAGVLIDKNGEGFLRKYGITDSKMISHPKRIEMAKIIKESAISYYTARTLPKEIDRAITTGTNLNTLEAIKTAEIVNALNTGKDKIKVIVDCPSVNIGAWKKTLLGYIEKKDNLDVVCEHKADANYIAVSAASIIAKVSREEEVEKIKKEFGDIGSGYPSDPRTKDFLIKNGKRLSDSGIFRKTWQTWKKVFPGNEQATLKGF